MTGRRAEARTWHPSAAPVAQVQDPAVAALFRTLARAVSMGLDTERGRRLLLAEIARRCGAGDDEDPPGAPVQNH